MTMRASYKICIGPDSTHLYNALMAEAEAKAPDKGRVTVDLEGECIIVRVTSRSLSGLRALSNSFLLLAYSAYSSLKQASEQ
ncbi:MAG: hypothetical protein F7C38_03985 [Desulfurococcales archaeon]|nr:hypothetical protein [Desulfurococcales archaeon]